ncbi:MAG: DNA-3-methyladenine glycosylase 2 family protein [Jatrophihabitans sp.]|nr:MAG: DNA-3-methyladenine glycosylase 2 family protein [Jatrophihabitans sp.]
MIPCPVQTGAVLLPDADTCYRAVQGRDARFDGWFFTAVRTTGIYCRPSCPAVTPRRENVTFHPSAAAAQRAGFRACRRCRPDATPGSPDWDVRGDLAGRALRLIGDGVVDRDGVDGLARRLGYSARQVHRTLVAEVGAGPIALARAQRAQAARVLLENTALPAADVAFAAGFASVRQFNDTVRAVFATTPSALRAPAQRHPPAEPGTLLLRLPYRAPMDAAATLEFLGTRAVGGVEAWDGTGLTRVLAAPHGPALVALSPGGDRVLCRVRLTDLRDLTTVTARVRRLLDLDADPVTVDAHLSRNRTLARLVRKRGGLRMPGCADGFEMALRAVLGQQISVARARTLLGQVAARYGRGAFAGEPWLVFPAPEALADVGRLPMPAARTRCVRAVARAFADGTLTLDPGADRDEQSAALLALPGIGPWTAGYLRMRALGDPDVLLATDLGVRHAAAAAGLDLADGRPEFAPWRSYLTAHLWASLEEGWTS